MSQERLQKIIAQSGVASRRKAEEIILGGRVRVNGQIIKELGTKADLSKDRIEVDGKTLAFERQVTILMNKPRGVVCTVDDPEGRATVIELIKGVKERLYPVGRLDFATSGALLLTNDGALSYALTHPKHDVEKTYLLKIAGKVTESALDLWRMGVDIGDVVTRPATVFRVEEEDNYTWVEVTIKEGRNRQIRRMAEATGLDVKKLKRVSFAGLTIEGLKVGQYRSLTERELGKLRQRYHIPGVASDRKRKPTNKRSPQSSAADKKETTSRPLKKGAPPRRRPKSEGKRTPKSAGYSNRKPKQGQQNKKNPNRKTR